jgi:hypothetical protein
MNEASLSKTVEIKGLLNMILSDIALQFQCITIAQTWKIWAGDFQKKKVGRQRCSIHARSALFTTQISKR